MCLKDANEITNSVDPDQTALSVSSGSSISVPIFRILNGNLHYDEVFFRYS